VADQAAPQRAEEQGYEPSDVAVRGVLWVGVTFVVTVSLSAALIGGLLGLFAAGRAPAIVSPLERVELVPPAPRLETRPLEALEQVRHRESELLHGYGWVDREAGIARIPIDRAMAILAERGWPGPAAGDPTSLRHAPPFATVPEPAPMDERQ
jgi:hypothetical protein